VWGGGKAKELTQRCDWDRIKETRKKTLRALSLSLFLSFSLPLGRASSRSSLVYFVIRLRRSSLSPLRRWSNL